MRVELKAWGISVVLIEPAQTDTDMWRTADDMVLRSRRRCLPSTASCTPGTSPGMKKFVPTSRKLMSPTNKVVAVVEEALTARRPRARYVVALLPKLQTALVTNMPAALRDRVMTVMVGLPRRPRG